MKALPVRLLLVAAVVVAAQVVVPFPPSAVLAHPSDHLATFDSFAEGGYGTQITDGGITFFALDVHAPGTPNPFPPPHQWIIERADATLGGMPGFTPTNAAGCCGIAPGPSAGFGRIGEFRMTTGAVETDASIELYGRGNPESSGTTVTLEAIRNGVVVGTNSGTFTVGGPVQHVHLEIAGVEFDQLRVSTFDGTAFPFFTGLIDTVRISNRGVGDTTPPSCFVSGLFAGPPKQQEVTVQDTGSGLAAIRNVQIVNGTVNVEPFAPGTTAPVKVTATKTDPAQPTVWSFDAVDVAGNVRHCA